MCLRMYLYVKIYVISSMWDYVFISLTQVMWRAQKRPIDTEENDVILALHFNLSEGSTWQYLIG